MATRTSVTRIVTSHFGTLRNHATQAPSARSYLVQIAFPIGAAVVAVLLGFRLRSSDEILAGLSILAGLLFALLVFVFQLRLQVTQDPRIPRGSVLLRLLDDLFANVAYSVVVGLVAASAALIAGSIVEADKALNSWWTGVLIALTVHFGLNIAMCLKRTQAAYHHLTR